MSPNGGNPRQYISPHQIPHDESLCHSLEGRDLSHEARFDFRRNLDCELGSQTAQLALSQRR